MSSYSSSSEGEKHASDEKHGITFEETRKIGHVDPLPRVMTSGPSGGLALTRNVTLPAESYPIKNPRTAAEFRTLSIHVYDSQQPGYNKKSAGNKESDVDYFSRVNFHKIAAGDCCQQFGVNPETGLEAQAAASRLSRNGRNLIAQHKKQYWKKLLKYFFGGFCSILWIG